MIFLSAEVVSGLGEDTFWTWFKREFKGSGFGIPQLLADEDVLLRYSTLGFLPVPGKSIALLWELLPEMKLVFKSHEWDEKLAKIYECARFCTYRVVSTPLAVPDYEEFGTVDIIPIGVDTNVFKPMPEKDSLRAKYNIPKNKQVGFWSGTTHPMKGFDRLREWAKNYPEVHWVIVWKQQTEAGYLPGANNFVHVPQNMLAELMNASDFILCCGMLRPFYMIEWEAMACNLPVIILDDIKKDFVPSPNPRDDIFRLGWDRPSVKHAWQNYLERKGVIW
ncbi:MAG: glycosyltransferase family 4 protein [Anaerolineales bacterium]|nr:glycosyltransferase family 4 protein [Anaerolineales bacterium]